jgi:hypothetical protein
MGSTFTIIEQLLSCAVALVCVHIQGSVDSDNKVKDWPGKEGE